MTFLEQSALLLACLCVVIGSSRSLAHNSNRARAPSDIALGALTRACPSQALIDRAQISNVPPPPSSLNVAGLALVGAKPERTLAAAARRLVCEREIVTPLSCNSKRIGRRLGQLLCDLAKPLSQTPRNATLPFALLIKLIIPSTPSTVCNFKARVGAFAQDREGCASGDLLGAACACACVCVCLHDFMCVRTRANRAHNKHIALPEVAPSVFVYVCVGDTELALGSRAFCTKRQACLLALRELARACESLSLLRDVASGGQFLDQDCNHPETADTVWRATLRNVARLMVARARTATVSELASSQALVRVAV